MNIVIEATTPANQRVRPHRSLRPAAAIRIGLQLGLLGPLVGCVGIPMQPGPTQSVIAPALAATKVFVYPSQAQTAQQLDRDRYECHLWAVEQTRFDPSQVALAPHQRTEVVATPEPGSEAAAGAIAGAAIGAITARSGHAAEGALVGAVIGGVAGAAAQTMRAEQDALLRRQSDESSSAQLERQSNDYRRALTACLEGRGYTVK